MLKKSIFFSICLGLLLAGSNTGTVTTDQFGELGMSQIKKFVG